MKKTTDINHQNVLFAAVWMLKFLIFFSTSLLILSQTDSRSIHTHNVFNHTIERTWIFFFYRLASLQVLWHCINAKTALMKRTTDINPQSVLLVVVLAAYRREGICLELRYCQSSIKWHDNSKQSIPRQCWSRRWVLKSAYPKSILPGLWWVSLPTRFECDLRCLWYRGYCFGF